jgi:hypothetical protein
MVPVLPGTVVVVVPGVVVVVVEVVVLDVVVVGGFVVDVVVVDVVVVGGFVVDVVVLDVVVLDVVVVDDVVVDEVLVLDDVVVVPPPAYVSGVVRYTVNGETLIWNCTTRSHAWSASQVNTCGNPMSSSHPTDPVPAVKVVSAVLVFATGPPVS